MNERPEINRTIEEFKNKHGEAALIVALECARISHISMEQALTAAHEALTRQRVKYASTEGEEHGLEAAQRPCPSTILEANRRALEIESRIPLVCAPQQRERTKGMRSHWEHQCKKPRATEARLGRVWACKCGLRFRVVPGVDVPGSQPRWKRAADPRETVTLLDPNAPPRVPRIVTPNGSHRYYW